MLRRSFTASRLALAIAAVLSLSACDRLQDAEPSASTEMDWVRAALERNPQYELVASDAEARVFTVRDKRTGQVQAVKLDELAATPVTQLQTQTARSSAPAAPTPAEEPAPTSASPQAEAQAPTPPTPSAAPEPTAEPDRVAQAPGYTIDRTGGQLRVSGPGVSIVSSGGGVAPGDTNDARRTVEPIVCEGRRMLHFDNREIYVDGDAVTVRDGCEMFITNSRIIASGTAVTIRNGTVHVSNSHIEGAQGSIDAAADAKLFARDSTFQGLSRRDELAMVQDQGGNRWR